MAQKDFKEDRMDTIIGPGAEIEGNLTVRGSMRLDGRLKGKVIVNGTFVLGKSGTFDGELRTKNAVIGGNLKGTIKVDEKIEFETGARFQGDITCKGLVVNDGVIFDGTCNMTKSGFSGHGEGPKLVKDDNKKK